MSIHDEWRREYKCSACKASFREGDEYRHGPGICSPTIADRALEQAQKSNKQVITPELPKNIELENFVQLGQAIQSAGGDPFIVLESLKPMLKVLAANQISIIAKHEGKR